MLAIPQYLGKRISSAGVKQIATGSGILHTVVLNQFGTNTALIVADASGAGTISTIATIRDNVGTAAIPATLIYDSVFTNGIKLSMSSTGDVTVTFLPGTF